MNDAANTLSPEQAAAEAKRVLQRVAPLIKAGKWPQVRELAEPNFAAFREITEGSFVVGLMYLAEGNMSEAIAWMRHCLQLDPEYHEAVFYLGAAMFKKGELQKSLILMKQFVREQPNHAKAVQLLAKILATQDRPELAEGLLQRVYALNPAQENIELDFAICYLGLGEHDKCKEWISKALEKQPESPVVIYNYVFMHGGKIDSDILKSLVRLEKQSNFSKENNGYLSFAIADAYAKRGQLDKAFEYYEKANKAQSELQPFSIKTYNDVVENTLDLVSQWKVEAFAPQHGCQEKGAIFVVGLPRSGTTLVQQIISSHSLVSGAGELAHLPDLILQRGPKITNTPFPQMLDTMTNEQYSSFGESYLKALRSYAETPYVIDKMPGNIFHSPFIRRALPNATIIFVHRDPIDVCWSLYRQRFSAEHSYSYDFDGMADYVQMTQRILQSYKDVLGDFIKEVHYEALVANPQDQSRQLIDSCGLDWEDGVMDYHKAKQKIRTASVLQANQPIYTTSQRSWEPIKEKLRPLIEALHAREVETCVSRGEVDL